MANTFTNLTKAKEDNLKAACLGITFLCVTMIHMMKIQFLWLD